jgi:hypothetical protein
MKRILMLTLAASALGGLLGMPARAARVDREFHESFEVAPGTRLELEHGDGDVMFSVWDRDVIQVDVVYRMDFSGVSLGTRGEFDVRFEQSGDAVRVIGREPDFRGIGVFSRTESEYRYTIQAPSYVELDLSGEDGDVDIEGWRAPVSVRLDDGDLALRDLEAERIRVHIEDGEVRGFGVRGDIDISTDDGDVDLVDCEGGHARIDVVDGDVHIRRCRTDLTLTSDDGDVRISELAARVCDIRTEDGDLELDLVQQGSPDVQLRSDDGDLEVTFAAGLNAEIDITNGDGHVRLDLPSAEIIKGKHQIRGRVGSGPDPGRIRISTADGSVTVRERG